ncbi:hypothetical protein IW262DRAFT_1290081 [Armillaria fumosa]|nr:hypothetical protein IW262DRAFT_1290081 [Armillaria fumosa]
MAVVHDNGCNVTSRSGNDGIQSESADLKKTWSILAPELIWILIIRLRLFSVASETQGPTFPCADAALVLGAEPLVKLTSTSLLHMKLKHPTGVPRSGGAKAQADDRMRGQAGDGQVILLYRAVGVYRDDTRLFVVSPRKRQVERQSFRSDVNRKNRASQSCSVVIDCGREACQNTSSARLSYPLGVVLPGSWSSLLLPFPLRLHYVMETVICKFHARGVG